jgi:hypothetical protein
MLLFYNGCHDLSFLLFKRSAHLTLIDVVDSAVKIGLGAAIGAISSFYTLKRTQSFEVNKRKEESFNKLIDERKRTYIEFSSLSHTLIQKYQYQWCDVSGDDYQSYLLLHSKVQILSPDIIRYAMAETFNAITVFISFSKEIISQDPETSELHDRLMSKAREKLAIFQKHAQLDVTQVYVWQGT